MTAAITIHYKNAKLTKRCVLSLLEDNWSPVLIWDNSEDEGESARELVNFFAKNPKVKIIVSRSNLGFGKGMNAAIAHLSEGGYTGDVLLINNDTQVKKGMREAMQNSIGCSDQPTLAAPCFYLNGKEQHWLYYQPWLALVTKSALPGSFQYLSGCCLLLSNIQTRQPLFDADFFMYGEDVELSWRFHQQGGRLLLVEGCWLEHEGSASTGQASENYERFLVQSHRLLAKKLSHNAASRTWMQILRVPSLLGRACVRSIRFRSLIPLKAFFFSS